MTNGAKIRRMMSVSTWLVFIGCLCSCAESVLACSIETPIVSERDADETSFKEGKSNEVEVGSTGVFTGDYLLLSRHFVSYSIVDSFVVHATVCHSDHQVRGPPSFV